MKAKQMGFTLPQMIITIILLAGAGGWVANIVKLADMTFDPLTGMAVLRCLGIVVPPLGAVMGYL